MISTPWGEICVWLKECSSRRGDRVLWRFSGKRRRRGRLGARIVAAAAPLTAQIGSDFLQHPLPIAKIRSLAQYAPAFFGFTTQRLPLVAKRKFLPISR